MTLNCLLRKLKRFNCFDALSFRAVLFPWLLHRASAIVRLRQFTSSETGQRQFEPVKKRSEAHVSVSYSLPLVGCCRGVVSQSLQSHFVEASPTPVTTDRNSGHDRGEQLMSMPFSCWEK